MKNNSELILYTDPAGAIKVEARLQDDNVWLTNLQLSELFQTTKSNVSEHIKHIFDEGELLYDSTVRRFRTVATNGKTYNMEHYNLDVIIALGYRVNSKIGTNFRKWATNILHEYMQKGYALNDNQLKNLGGGEYWYELQNRLRDIRSSEKVFWRQVLDIFATSVDYDPKSNEAQLFFKKVQNKLHFAVHGQTAAEAVFERANSNKDFMGLTTFNGSLPTKDEVIVAKNYLTSAELSDLNHIVSGYLEFAENKAIRHETMYMKDWVTHLDHILVADDRKLLANAGTISQDKAENKALKEYDKFKERVKFELTPVEKSFLDSLNDINKRLTD